MRRSKLKTALRAREKKGYLCGSSDAIKKLEKDFLQITKEHARQLKAQEARHKKEIRSIEKRYNVKHNLLDKKISHLESLNSRKEEELHKVLIIKAEAKSIVTQMKKDYYQTKKTHASVLDNEKSLDVLGQDIEVQRQNGVMQ